MEVMIAFIKYIRQIRALRNTAHEVSIYWTHFVESVEAALLYGAVSLGHEALHDKWQSKSLLISWPRHTLT